MTAQHPSHHNPNQLRPARADHCINCQAVVSDEPGPGKLCGWCGRYWQFEIVSHAENLADEAGGVHLNSRGDFQ